MSDNRPAPGASRPSAVAESVAAESREPASVRDVIDYVKAYAKQETLDPLKGVGRWVGFGAAGAVAVGIGVSLMLLGLLRLVQYEWDRSARGSLSWLSYLIVIAVCAVVLALVVRKINSDPLTKESK